MQIAAHSPSRLLRAGQTGRCRSCGNRIDWYQRDDNRPTPPHLTAAATTDVPAACRRHTSNGIAYPHDDGSGWCRLPHAAQCPRASQHRVTSPRQTLLSRHLTVRSHRLIDTSALTPAPSTSSTLTETTSPDLPVVRILLTPYHAQEPVEIIRSIAQTRQRHRCTRPSLDPPRPAERWTPLPVQPHHSHPALPGGTMAVHNLNHPPYGEQLRWRTQRCTTHTALSAADLPLADRQPLTPLLRTAHIRTQLPHPAPHQPNPR
ncbi:DUF6083 domain-containing protein [Streptomyces cellulosae]